jgi:hypothetical protein
MEHTTNLNRDERLGDELAVAAVRAVVETSYVAPDDADEHAEAGGQTLANVYIDPKRHTVTLLLDDITANTVMYAVRMLAADSEAHAREVRRVQALMPADSYGVANRHEIASRLERIARRLLMLDRNYRRIVG